MSLSASQRFRALLRREYLEHRGAFFWTPIAVAALLGVLMLGSVLLANRISPIGDLFLQTLLQRGEVMQPGMAISITLDDGRVVQPTPSDRPEPPGAAESPQPSGQEIVIEVEDEAAREPWNFSRDWTFQPPRDDVEEPDAPGPDATVQTLNPVLNVVHGLILLIAYAVIINYLLGALYDDRKDRSILFWNSMPISEWEVVLSKFATGLVVVPLVYTAVSLALQTILVLLVLFMGSRMELDPVADVLARIDFGSALRDSLGGWLLTALWVAPACAWLLLASAVTRRAPFLTAMLPVLGLLFIDKFLLGGRRVGEAVLNHVPHFGDGGSVGFYVLGLSIVDTDLISLVSGLLFAAVLLAAAVWARRHRWEI